MSAKALVFDEQGRLLVFRDDKGEWEIPGGGWEHGETFEECVRRELMEEAQAEVASIGKGQCIYAFEHPKGYHKLCIAVPVTLTHHNFVPTMDDLVEARFVTKEEFLALPFQADEQDVQNHTDEIWSLR